MAPVAATASAVAAFILVRITRRYTDLMATYTEHTNRMVHEMRAEREDAMRPRLVPLVRFDEANTGRVHVQNIGPGIALDVQVVLSFEPGEMRSRITLPFLLAGEQRPWQTSRRNYLRGVPAPYSPEAHLPNHTHVHLTGTCRDLLGRTHAVDVRTPVVDGWEVWALGQWTRNFDPMAGA
jgi:hypothetical protein